MSSYFLLLLPQDPASTNLHVSMDLPIPDFHINGLIQYVALYICLLSFSMFSRFFPFCSMCRYFIPSFYG